VAAVEQAPQTFEHVDPATVGGEQRILVSELSGKGAVLRRARDIGLQLEGDDQRVAVVLKRLKEREHSGYHYEAADGSTCCCATSWRRTSRCSASRASA